MGARWAWWARCKKGHVYSNFSGGADDCYTCNEPPVKVLDCTHWDGGYEGCDCQEEISKAPLPSGTALRLSFALPGKRTLALRPEAGRVVVSVQTHDGSLYALSLEPTLARALASGLEACLSEVGEK